MTYRLRYNNTHTTGKKCSICGVTTSEAHIFIESKHDELQEMKQPSTEKVDISKIILTNILPNGRGKKEGNKIHKLVDGYRYFLGSQYRKSKRKEENQDM